MGFGTGLKPSGARDRRQLGELVTSPKPEDGRRENGKRKPECERTDMRVDKVWCSASDEFGNARLVWMYVGVPDVGPNRYGGMEERESN